MLAGYRVADAEPPAGVAVYQAAVRRPGGGVCVVGRGRHVGEPDGSGGGGASGGAVKDRRQLGPGHIVVHSEAAVAVAVDIAVFRRPPDGPGEGMVRVYIGEGGFHGAGRGGQGQRCAQRQHKGVKSCHSIHQIILSVRKRACKNRSCLFSSSDFIPR